MRERERRSKLVSIASAVPEFKYEQSELADWMNRQLNAKDSRLKRKFQVLYKKTRIKTRYSVLSDFDLEKKHPKLFSNERKEPLVEERLAVYNSHALPLAKKAAEKSLKNFSRSSITHLITVSCTGMSAPGIEIQLKQELGLQPTVQCHAVNFVGCYAVFPAIKMADAFCKADPNAKVLIVAVELCTLHFQNKETDDHLLSNALFADGAASVLVVGEEEEHAGLIVSNSAGLLIPKGRDDMAWNIHSEGFLMKLSSYIPDLVDEGIHELIEQLLKKGNHSKENIDHWAIHPGGRKILEVCEKELGLAEGKLSTSYQVLSEFGNMSAPTILFVLEKMWNEGTMNSGATLFACGFGPGLTLESILFEVD